MQTLLEQLPIATLLLLFIGLFVKSTLKIKDELSKEHDSIIEIKKDIEYLKQMRNDQKEDLHNALERTKDVNVWFERLRNLETRLKK